MFGLLDPLTMWQEKYPDGFSGTREVSLPVLGNKLMIGADVRVRGVEHSAANIEARFHDKQLDVSVSSGSTNNYGGLVLAMYKFELPEFDTLRLHAAASTVVEVGRVGAFNMLPQGDKETPFGTFNEMIAFTLGHTSLECFVC